jgi:hypothetical protein
MMVLILTCWSPSLTCAWGGVMCLFRLQGWSQKVRLMMRYYEKLQRVLWVSENWLHHAYAWYQLFHYTINYKLVSQGIGWDSWRQTHRYTTNTRGSAACI